jgi:23S rRNA pseudouridine2604 synthase
VELNGKKAYLTDKVYDGDMVAVDSFPINAKKKHHYIAFNKPIGVTCTTDTKDKTNIIDFINFSERIFPIGRLDKDSSGLILLTDDGDVVNNILRKENNHEKEYLVRVNRPIESDFVKKMTAPMIIDRIQTKPCKVKVTSKHEFRIILTQGLNRQIRKMCQNLGYRVTDLIRIRIMDIHLGTIKIGKWRKLSDVEIQTIKK